MMKISLMIEGQNGLNWPHWMHVARAAEDLGFAGLYRSDHYTNGRPPDKDSLELWVSLTWLASHTSRIEFGPLVSPISFRQPTMTARMAAAVDDLSGGRLVLGLGAGWQEREHHNYSWDLLPIDKRFQRFDEGLEIISLLLNSNEPVDYDGEYYQLHEAIVLPHPQRRSGPPILIGGNGEKRTLPLAARLGDEWNAVYVTPAEFSRLSARLDEMLLELDREPGEVRRSLMTGCVYGRTRSEVEDKVRNYPFGLPNSAELRSNGVLVGDGGEMSEQLAELEQSGVQQVMLQWLDLDDMAGLESLAQQVITG